MTERLKQLLARAHSQRMNADEREDQLRNFVAGNVGLENERVTRAVVDEAVKHLGTARA